MGLGSGSAKGESGASDGAWRGKESLRNGPGSAAGEPTVPAGILRTPAAEVAARKVISVGDEAPKMPILVEGEIARCVGVRDNDEAINSEGRTWRRTRVKVERAEMKKENQHA